MRSEDAERLETVSHELNRQFGLPDETEPAIQRVLLASAALAPIPALAENPAIRDLAEQTIGWLNDLYDALESDADDVQILEPGTLGDQDFTDLPTRGPRR